jgi:hypothetical protein
VALAFGEIVFRQPWIGVYVSTALLCGAICWALQAFVPPVWALLGGLLAVARFALFSYWMNSYWGGTLAATGGCLVFGALPRLQCYWRPRDMILVGLGFGMHMLARQFESVLLLLAILAFFIPGFRSRADRGKVLRSAAIALYTVLPIALLILLQNRAVTHSWFTLPEQLSQYQYGVPTSLSIQPPATPHVPLTPQQELDYRAQMLMHGPGTDTPSKFLLRLEYRVRYYRFFFSPPLYIAAVAFLLTLRERRARWIVVALLIFALGTNLFPYLLLHYLAAVTCLFVLVSVLGLRRLANIQVRRSRVGLDIVRVLVVLCGGEFFSWYALHLFETPATYPILQFETWDSINHEKPDRRQRVGVQLDAIHGDLLVFVRYTPHHIYQEEWVWNSAAIDSARVVYARDLGADENQKLIRYYPNRRILLLEPDLYPARLSDYNAHS